MCTYLAIKDTKQSEITWIQKEETQKQVPYPVISANEKDESIEALLDHGTPPQFKAHQEWLRNYPAQVEKLRVT